MYAYVYPYNHKNMLLGCPGRGPTHWYRFGGPRTFGNHEKMEVSQNCHLSLYCNYMSRRCQAEINMTFGKIPHLKKPMFRIVL